MTVASSSSTIHPQSAYFAGAHASPTHGTNLRLRPPSPMTLDAAATDKYETSREFRPHTFLRGAVVGGLSSAVGYALPYSDAFLALSTAGKTGVFAGIATFCGGASHPMEAGADRGARIWRILASTLTAAASTVAGALLGTAPAFLALDAASKVGAWVALGGVAAGLNALIVHRPTLVATTALGVAAGVSAVLFAMSSPSALAVAAAGALGASLGATVHKEVARFGQYASDNAIASVALVASLTLAYAAAAL